LKEHYEKMLPGARLWTGELEMESEAIEQIRNVTKLPILAGPVAVMPDVHYGIGATVGSVIPTVGAIIPAAVGVDIGCGMCATRTTLLAKDLPESLKDVRAAIEPSSMSPISVRSWFARPRVKVRLPRAPVLPPLIVTLRPLAARFWPVPTAATPPIVPAAFTPAVPAGVPKRSAAALPPVTATLDAEPQRFEVSASAPPDSVASTAAPAAASTADLLMRDCIIAAREVGV